ncbi:MAG TPA: response regulator, partial [Prolixibacteraceae bacterium]|nr:response regulator [Prolixibacteraceae bacterium]
MKVKKNTMRILILEDNYSDADLSKRALERNFRGCSIDLAATLNAARQFLDKDSGYDVALLDMNLPDGNGLEFLTELKARKTPTAIVVFTSAGNEELAVAALKAGADDYIAKKTDFTRQLPGVIRFALEGHQKKILFSEEKIRVLYIEHHAHDVDLTRRHLKKYAPFIQLETYPTASEALAVLTGRLGQKTEDPFDAILMDYRLPGMNALDLIKTIRQEHMLDIPVIIVTGQGDEETAVQALKLGATDYLTKNENYLFRLPTIIVSAHQQQELLMKQAQLIESESKYRLLAEHSGDVIFILDKDMNYQYLSPAIKALRGYEPEEAMKLNLSQVLTPESYKIARNAFNRIFKPDSLPVPKEDSSPQTLELEMFRKDGTTVWTEVKASLFMDENGSVAGIVGVTREITQRKKATEELRKLLRAVEQSHDSILITNTRGEIEYCNPSVAKISGYEREEIIGRNPRIFKSGNKSTQEYKALWDTIS